MASVDVDVSELKVFFSMMGDAAGKGFRDELAKFLDGLGNEFLRIVQDEIVRRGVVDTRLLLSSFHRDSEDGVWRLDEGGLSLEVGSSVEYAGYVNDGHWTNTKGVAIRFVPGYWEGDRFTYDPDAEGGMVLKQHWVEGRHYFDAALRILDKMMPGILDAKLQQWIDEYFKGA